MGQYFKIHPENPQKRLIDKAAAILEEDGIMVYPTDTNYGLGCSIFNRKGVERIVRLKELKSSHQLSILCADLSDISTYARVDNPTYRLIKRFLPGPYTFVLKASREVPKSILPKRETIGLRIPDHPICLDLLKAFGKPVLSTSFRLPGQQIESDPEKIREMVETQVDMIIDGGVLPSNPSTVVDLTGESPVVLREGVGDPSIFQG
ncbi:MAG: threonylcarbamoyl-AMP synthase [Magnetococcales bacterium]|nr:threonylcarbamoyl-AMP synthase [Magnetococcales bacterium]